MSHGVTVDVAKFSARFDKDYRTTEDYQSLESKFCELDCYKEMLTEEPEEEIEPGPTGTQPENGWKNEGWADFGKHKNISGYIWKKGKHKVYCWNCSQYNNVGVIDPMVASDNRASIEEFIKDFSDKFNFSKIEKDDAVQSWS